MHRLKSIITILKKIMIYFLMIINYLGIFIFVFSRFYVQKSNPSMSFIEIIVLEFICILSITFIKLISKKKIFAIYGYMGLSILCLIVGLLGNYLTVINYSKFSLVSSIFLFILIYAQEKVVIKSL